MVSTLLGKVLDVNLFHTYSYTMNLPHTPLHERAADNLRYIRETMERASEFTAVPGYGGVAMGVSAIIFGVLASMQPSPEPWFRVWLADLAVGFVTAAIAMALKSKKSRVPLFSGAGRKFLLSFSPPVAAGGILTFALASAGQYTLMPAIWLLCYGAGVLAGGSASIRLIPMMGAVFFGLGFVAAALPQWGNIMMIAGFGVTQIVFGIIIGRRYGG